MKNYQDIRNKISTLFQQLPPEEQQLLVEELKEISTAIVPKNIDNLLKERGISKGMYGNVEGFHNNEENVGKRGESAFKNRSMSEAIRAMRAKRRK